MLLLLAAKLVIDELDDCFEAEWELRRLRRRGLLWLRRFINGLRLRSGLEEAGERRACDQGRVVEIRLFWLGCFGIRLLE